MFGWLLRMPCHPINTARRQEVAFSLRQAFVFTILIEIQSTADVKVLTRTSPLCFRMMKNLELKMQGSVFTLEKTRKGKISVG
jgi:hypothetical protein